MRNEEIVTVLREIVTRLNSIINCLLPCEHCRWNDLCESQPYTPECKERADLTNLEERQEIEKLNKRRAENVPAI